MWLYLESFMISEQNQEEKDKYCIFFNSMWNLKIKNKQTKKEDHRITNLKNKYIVSIEENCGGGKIGE